MARYSSTYDDVVDGSAHPSDEMLTEEFGFDHTEDVSRIPDRQLDALMGVCHYEPAEPEDCVCCRAYQESCRREENESAAKFRRALFSVELTPEVESLLCDIVEECLTDSCSQPVEIDAIGPSSHNAAQRDHVLSKAYELARTIRRQQVGR